MTNEEAVMELVEKYLSKKNAIGYFFIVGEVVHPFYLDTEEDFQRISEEDAWEIICDGLLDLALNEPVKELKNCFLRGIVTDRIEIGNLSDFYVDQVRRIFKTPEDFPVVENPQYRIDTKVEVEVFLQIKKICKYIPYLVRLPWEVKSHLSSHSLDVEKIIIDREMINNRLRIVHARLGALKRSNANQSRPNSSNPK